MTDWRPVIAAKLEELAALPTGWDRYNAVPIYPGAIARALALLDAVMGEGTPAPSVVPLCTGGVQLEWHCRSMDIEVSVEPSELVRAYAEELWHDGWTGEWTFADDNAGLLRDVLARVGRRVA